MNGRRYVVDVRQSWSKYDKPCKIYIVSRMYTEEEYKLTFPHKYKKGKTFKQGQLYKKESEYNIIYLSNRRKKMEAVQLYVNHYSISIM